MAWPLLCLVAGPSPAVLAQLTEPHKPQPQQQTTDCPPQDLSALTTQLMLDLPSYGNRVIQRSRSLGETSSLYLILAGQPEIRPVDLAAFADDPHRSRLPAPKTRKNVPAEDIYQIHFTTLERQYALSASPTASSLEQALRQAAPSFQQFHRLILARQRDPAHHSPWQILSLRSQLVPYPIGDPSGDRRRLTSIRDSRKGPVGQGIALWLRDWQSGALRSSAVNPDLSPAHDHCQAQSARLNHIGPERSPLDSVEQGLKSVANISHCPKRFH